ncbi:AAA-associated domain-containing protein [Microcoleus sp. C2C3]|uniref:AAA-associated domain-containing protein n=1 Tax=unclassified Microcoleus TaxID=2642155 RepID=UPI002FD528A4
MDLLETHFSPQEAMRQLKTAIDWGRYAELYSYDELGGEIFLESEDFAAISTNSCFCTGNGFISSIATSFN